MTPSAQSELLELEQEQNQIRNKQQTLNSLPYDIRRREQNRLDVKYYKLEDKKNDIKQTGLSTKELSAIKRESSNFTRLNSDKTLGSSSVESVGHSKKLNAYVKIKYTKYSDFMRNVRGMGSYAGKKDIRSVRIIPAPVYEKIKEGISKKGAISTGSFMGGSWSNRGKKNEPMSEVLRRIF